MEDVCATGSPAEAFVRLRNDDLQLSLEERARLLYVAMTRARELVILAMDAGVSRGKVAAPTFDVETDLTYDVLRRILPTDALDMPQLDADRLVFDNSQPGDYELISLANFTFGDRFARLHGDAPHLHLAELFNGSANKVGFAYAHAAAGQNEIRLA